MESTVKFKSPEPKHINQTCELTNLHCSRFR